MTRRTENGSRTITIEQNTPQFRQKHITLRMPEPQEASEQLSGSPKSKQVFSQNQQLEDVRKERREAFLRHKNANTQLENNRATDVKPSQPTISPQMDKKTFQQRQEFLKNFLEQRENNPTEAQIRAKKMSGEPESKFEPNQQPKESLDRRREAFQKHQANKQPENSLQSNKKKESIQESKMDKEIPQNYSGSNKQSKESLERRAEAFRDHKTKEMETNSNVVTSGVTKTITKGVASAFTGLAKAAKGVFSAITSKSNAAHSSPAVDSAAVDFDSDSDEIARTVYKPMQGKNTYSRISEGDDLTTNMTQLEEENKIEPFSLHVQTQRSSAKSQTEMKQSQFAASVNSDQALVIELQTQGVSDEVAMRQLAQINYQIAKVVEQYNITNPPIVELKDNHIRITFQDRTQAMQCIQSLKELGAHLIRKFPSLAHEIKQHQLQQQIQQALEYIGQAEEVLRIGSTAEAKQFIENGSASFLEASQLASDSDKKAVSAINGVLNLVYETGNMLDAGDIKQAQILIKRIKQEATDLIEIQIQTQSSGEQSQARLVLTPEEFQELLPSLDEQLDDEMFMQAQNHKVSKAAPPDAMATTLSDRKERVNDESSEFEVSSQAAMSSSL